MSDQTTYTPGNISSNVNPKDCEKIMSPWSMSGMLALGVIIGILIIVWLWGFVDISRKQYSSPEGAKAGSAIAGVFVLIFWIVGLTILYNKHKSHLAIPGIVGTFLGCAIAGASWIASANQLYCDESPKTERMDEPVTEPSILDRIKKALRRLDIRKTNKKYIQDKIIEAGLLVGRYNLKLNNGKMPYKNLADSYIKTVVASVRAKSPDAGNPSWINSKSRTSNEEVLIDNAVKELSSDLISKVATIDLSLGGTEKVAALLACRSACMKDKQKDNSESSRNSCYQKCENN